MDPSLYSEAKLGLMESECSKKWATCMEWDNALVDEMEKTRAVLEEVTNGCVFLLRLADRAGLDVGFIPQAAEQLGDQNDSASNSSGTEEIRGRFDYLHVFRAWDDYRQLANDHRRNIDGLLDSLRSALGPEREPIISQLNVEYIALLNRGVAFMRDTQALPHED